MLKIINPLKTNLYFFLWGDYVSHRKLYFILYFFKKKKKSNIFPACLCLPFLRSPS